LPPCKLKEGREYYASKETCGEETGRKKEIAVKAVPKAPGKPGLVFFLLLYNQPNKPF
jgi:hypothetical protein